MSVCKEKGRLLITFLLLLNSSSYLLCQIAEIEKLCKQSPDSCLGNVHLYSEKVQTDEQFKLNILAGNAYLKKGDYQNAINEFEIAQQLLAEVKTSKRDSFLYRIKNDMGICQDELGDDRKAEKSFLEALEYIRRLSDSLEHVARVYTNLAILHSTNGNLETALNYTKAAIEIGPVKKGEETKWKQIDQINLFALHYSLGEYRMALNILKKTWEGSKDEIEEDIQSNIHFDLGLCYQALEEYDSAIFHFTQALRKNSEKEKDIVFRADKSLHLAMAYLGANQLEKAMNQTLLVSHMELPPGPAKARIDARRYFILGQSQIRLGRYDESVVSLQNAWKQIKASLSRDHFSSENLKLLLVIAKAYASFFHDLEPNKSVEAIIDALSYFNADSILHSETLPLSNLNNKHKELYQMLIELIDTKLNKGAEGEELIFSHYQKYNSFQFASKLRSHSLSDAKDKAVQNLIKKISSQKAKINHLQLNRQFDSIDEFRADLRSLQISLDLQDISSRSMRLNNELNTVSLANLKEFSRASQSIFICFILSEYNLTTLVIDSLQLKVYPTKLPYDFEETVEAFGDLIRLYPQAQISGEKAIKDNIRGITRLSQELYEIVLAPIFPIKGKRMVIAADGILSSVPFAALTLESSLNSPNIDADHFLISHYDIAYFNPFSAYDASKFYQLSQVGIIAPFAKKHRKKMDYFLPGSKKAIDQIDEKGVANHLHEGVSKAKLEILMQNQEAIHFATHAESSQTHAGHLYLMCGPDPFHFDDRLYRDDLSRFTIYSPLITLSGCQTGAGPRQSGQMESLGQAFLRSGASHLLTTLWNIDDRTNHRIMADFYAGFDNQQGSSASFGGAVRNYFRENQGIHLHPFHWAGYQLIDGGSRLQIRRKRLFGPKSLLVLGTVFLGWMLLKWKRVA